MGRNRKNLNEKEKETIAYLYKNTNHSLGKLAETLNVSIATIYEYKDHVKK